MTEIATPHDTFFRESFGRREIAVDFLRHHLPPELLAEIDLETLESSKDTYVSADLRSAYSDLVYRVRHRDGPLTIAEIKGEVLTRLVQLAMRWVFSQEPLARLSDLLTLIEQVEDRAIAL